MWNEKLLLARKSREICVAWEERRRNVATKYHKHRSQFFSAGSRRWSSQILGWSETFADTACPTECKRVLLLSAKYLSGWCICGIFFWVGNWNMVYSSTNLPRKGRSRGHSLWTWRFVCGCAGSTLYPPCEEWRWMGVAGRSANPANILPISVVYQR